MTRLDKPLSRLMRVGERDLVVTLDPAGLIRLREPRKRTGYEYPLEAVYWRAAQRAAEELVAERKAKRRARRST